MTGKYKIRVANSRCEYELEIKRNITIIRGNSGKGKTRLFNMISEYKRLGKSSGIKMSCDIDVIAYNGNDWKFDFSKIKKSIIFIDEDNNNFIRSEDFASFIKKTDNYFVIIARNYLPDISHSIKEIYEPDNSRKKIRLKNCYKERDEKYVRCNADFERKRVPDIVIIEDTNAGFQYFSFLFSKIGVVCILAGGRTKIFDLCKKYYGKRILIIADGAAFGSEIEDICILNNDEAYDISIFLPESFEYMLLAADIIENVDKRVLLETWNYVESKKYFSWEKFFESYIKEITKESRIYKYDKRKINKYYLEERNIEKMTERFKGIKFNI